MESAPISMFDLPNEILLLIFTSLVQNPKSLTCCRGVCRRFRECIDGSVLLQLGIKLSVWGYELLPVALEHHSTSPSDILQALDAHVEAWRQLKWKQTSVEIPTGAAYDLAHGYYVSVSRPSSCTEVTVVKLPTSTQHQTQLSNEDNLTSIPLVYTLPEVHFEIEDLAIDPSQDLLILEEM